VIKTHPDPIRARKSPHCTFISEFPGFCVHRNVPDFQESFRMAVVCEKEANLRYGNDWPERQSPMKFSPTKERPRYRSGDWEGEPPWYYGSGKPGPKTALPFISGCCTTTQEDFRCPIACISPDFFLRREKNPSGADTGPEISSLYLYF
jgi:hypothetical protein